MDDKLLRDHLVELLQGGHAHLNFEAAIAGLPEALRGPGRRTCLTRPGGCSSTCGSPSGTSSGSASIRDHVSPEFPDGYWPEGDAPPDPSAWDRAVEGFRADLKAMIDLVLDPETDLFAPIAHGQGQTILREALLVADHNAYHLGQLVTVRRLLGAWSEG